MKAVRPVIEPCNAKVYCVTSNIKCKPDLFSELKCIAEPRDDDKLLCADGDTGSKWTGCVDRGSVRIQCPKNSFPCNNMNSNNEFICSSDCSKHGDKRTTCYADSDGDD